MTAPSYVLTPDEITKLSSDMNRGLRWGELAASHELLRSRAERLERALRAITEAQRKTEGIYSVGDCMCQYGEHEHSDSECPQGIAELALFCAIDAARAALADVTEEGR